MNLSAFYNYFCRLTSLYVLKKNKVKVGSRFFIKGILKINNRGTFVIGNDVRIISRYSSNPVGNSRHCGFFLKKNAKLLIGNNVGMSNVTIYSSNSITIEDNVLLGGGVQIYDSDFHALDYQERVHLGDNLIQTRPILIEEGAFIGTSTIILKGVTIGSRSIVAAGSVVAKNIPPNEIWGGNPVRFIRNV